MFDEIQKCILTAYAQQNEKLMSNSYYLDSSGRACLSVPLELSFPTEQCLKECLDANCFYPKPIDDEIKDDSEEDGSRERPISNIAIEAKVALTFGSGEAILALVEQVRIHSITVLSPSSVLFETDVFIRVSLVEGSTQWRMTDVKVAVDISPVLHQRLPDKNDGSTDSALTMLKNTMTKSIDAAIRNIRTSRTSSLSIKAHLTQALTVHVDSVSGPTVGETFLAVHIRHSSTHKEPVTITRIALHPLQEESTLALPRTTSSTIRWGFAEHCDPCLPITLNPDESFSTILLVDASQESNCRTFKCPVSVTALLGKRENSNTEYRYQVTTSAHAEFTSSPMASEPSDGFILDFQLVEENIQVGSLVVVRVHVRNLSNDTRGDLMLLVGKDDDADGEQQLALATNDVSRLEVPGELDDDNKIGVSGVCVSEIMNSPYQALIALDTGYILPQIDGHSAITADLRFIPLTEGIVTFPRIQVVDPNKGVTYMSFHRFRAVIAARKQH